MVPVLRRVVEDPDPAWIGNRHLNDLFQGLLGKFGTLNRFVEIIDIGFVMLAVVKADRRRRNRWGERVIRVGQWRQRKRPRRLRNASTCREHASKGSSRQSGAYQPAPGHHTFYSRDHIILPITSCLSD